MTFRVVRKQRKYMLLLGLTLLGACQFARDESSQGGVGSTLSLRAKIYPTNTTYVQTVFETLLPNEFNSNPSSISSFWTSGHVNVLSSLGADWAWSHQTDCRSIRIGIVDSGVDETHPELASNLYVLPSTSGVHGRNYYSSEVGYNPDVVNDKNGHGTHVAGIIGAKANNNAGIMGACWDSEIVVSRVTSSTGASSTLLVIQGIDFVMNMGAKVVNISMGNSAIPNTTASEQAQYESTFEPVTTKAQNQGVILVAAAGNDRANSNNDRTYPAGLSSPNIIAVAANDTSALATGYTNYGGGVVHLSAPGSTILSTYSRDWAQAPTSCLEPNGNKTGYAVCSGTSMATPFVTGTLALMWSNIGASNISATQLIELFLKSGKTMASRGVPGDLLITGAQLHMGRALEAAIAY